MFPCFDLKFSRNSSPGASQRCFGGEGSLVRDRSVVPVQHANDAAGVKQPHSMCTPSVALPQFPSQFYVERNQNLKDNFENHTER